MRVYTAFDLFHSVPKKCDPNFRIPVEGPKSLSRAELEESDYELCEVCFLNW